MPQSPGFDIGLGAYGGRGGGWSQISFYFIKRYLDSIYTSFEGLAVEGRADLRVGGRRWRCQLAGLGAGHQQRRRHVLPHRRQRLQQRRAQLLRRGHEDRLCALQRQMTV